MNVQTVTKKPVDVQAVLWSGEMEEALEIVNWITGNGFDARYVTIPAAKMRDRIIIRTLEGNMVAMPGDWVIQGVQGEFYPCKPEIFDQIYDHG